MALPGVPLLLLLNKVFPSQQDINPFQLPPERGGGVHIPWRKVALIPVEDGAFYVPLLLLGVTVPHAAIFAFLFGAFHYPHYAVIDCIFKRGIFFVASLWVLPHGLGSIVVGHLLQDVIVLALLQITTGAAKKQDAAHK